MKNRVWKKYRFSDFVNINPSVTLNANEEYSFVEMKDLDNSNRYCSPKLKKIKGGGSRFQNNDILFARITPCLENGKICQVKNLENNLGFGSTEFHVFRGKENISDTDFIYYLSRWDNVRDHAEINLDGTSGRQRVPKACFDDLEIFMPGYEEQILIVNLLTSLDNKIHLLQEQNLTLEALAETLFHQWFVVGTNKDWKETNLLDIIELIGGGTPKTTMDEYWNGNIKWLSGGDISSNHKSFIVNSEKTITEKGLKNSSAKLLPKYSTVISARGTVGKYSILSEPMAFSQSNYGIYPKFKNCYFFTYLLINHSVEELNSSAYGSVFDTITTNTFKGINVRIPTEKIIQDFEKSVSNYFFKIENNQSQIQTLTQLRNTLLPKLMSGEIRIK